MIEYVLPILAIGTGIYGAAHFAFGSYNRAQMKNSLWKVSKKFDDEGEGISGEIVKIKEFSKDMAVVQVVTAIKERREYAREYARQYDPYCGYAMRGISQYGRDGGRSGGSNGVIEAKKYYYEDTFPEGCVPLKYLKIVKKLSEKTNKKGGEKKVKRMPRLWKWLIIYIPTAILVWDFVTNINGIVLFLANNVLIHR